MNRPSAPPRPTCCVGRPDLASGDFRHTDDCTEWTYNRTTGLPERKTPKRPPRLSDDERANRRGPRWWTEETKGRVSR